MAAPPPSPGGAAPIQPPSAFRRTDSSYSNESAGENHTSAVVDPRSPGVPRTPGGNARKQFGGGGAARVPQEAISEERRSSHESSSTSRHVQADVKPQGSEDAPPPEPDSPLNQVVHQTPVRQPPSNGATAAAPPTSGGGGGSGGGGDTMQPGPSPIGRLCCCLQSLTTNETTGQRDSRKSSATEVTRYSSRNGPRGEDFAGDRAILPPMAEQDRGKKCLVLDLDETLVHSSFRAVPNPNYIIPVKIEEAVHHVYVCKRPGVDEFLERAGRCFEIVIYTASLNKYADPLLDKLDTGKVIRHRLFRESCTLYQGNYVKNLSLLGRDLSQTIIVDNSHLSYLFHPDNAIGCTSWIDQKDDVELKVIEDFCEAIMDADDVRDHCHNWRCGGSYQPRRP